MTTWELCPPANYGQVCKVPSKAAFLYVLRKPGKCVRLRNANCGHILVAQGFNLPENFLQTGILNHFVCLGDRWSARRVNNRHKEICYPLSECVYRATCPGMNMINSANMSGVHLPHLQGSVLMYLACFIKQRTSLNDNTAALVAVIDVCLSVALPWLYEAILQFLLAKSAWSAHCHFVIKHFVTGVLFT